MTDAQLEKRNEYQVLVQQAHNLIQRLATRPFSYRVYGPHGLLTKACARFIRRTDELAMYRALVNSTEPPISFCGRTV